MSYELEIRLEKAEQALRVSEATVRTLVARLEALEKKVDIESQIATAKRLNADLQPKTFFLRRLPKP